MWEVLVSNIFNANHFHFYVPFGTKTDISDLATSINRSNASGAIFNEKYSVTDLPETKCLWPVQDEVKNETAFVIYSWSTLQSDSAVSIREATNGQGIYVDIDPKKVESEVDRLGNKKVTKKDKFYFRFRVNIPDATTSEALVRKYTPANTFLQSTFATTYIVDFRINDLRSLPDFVSSVVIQRGNNFVKISKLHFLLMTKAYVDVEAGTEALSIRELELNTWDDYVGRKFDTEDVVAYHCAKKEEIRKWEFFAKLKVNNSNLKVALLYLSVLGITSIIFNLISSWLYSLLEYLLAP